MFWRIDSYLPNIYCVSDISISAGEYKNGKVGSFPLSQSKVLKLDFDRWWADCVAGEFKCGE